MRIAIFFICLLMQLAAWGQLVRQYAFTHFSTANGLASNFVNSIVQDGDGYIWLATVNGLQRYDGYRFQLFRTARGRSGALPSDNVTALYLDKKDNLWVITAGQQFGIFNTRTFQYRPVPMAGIPKSSNNPVTFLETPDGQLLVQEVYGPMYQWNESANLLEPTSKLDLLPQNWRCRKMVWDEEIRKFWIAADSGLALYNPATKKLSYRNHNVENSPAIHQLEQVLNIMEVFIYKDGNVNLISWPPRTGNPFIYHFDRQTGHSTRYNLMTSLGLAYHEVGGFLQQQSGRLWVAGRPFLAEFQPSEKKFIPVDNQYRNEQSIRFDVVTGLLEDREQNIWIGTDNGLFLFNPDAHKFSNYYPTRPGTNKIQEGPVHALLQTKDKNILVGTWNLGLFQFDSALNPIVLPPALRSMQQKLSVWDLHQHSQSGQIWITLQGGGLVVYNPKTEKAEQYFPPIFNASTIRQVTEDRQGNLWFGTQSGKIIKWDRQTAAGDFKKGYSLVITTGLVHDLLTDSRGFVWAATLEQGLLQINPVQNKVVQKYQAQGPKGKILLNNSPTDLLQYDDTTLIAVSNGLNLINPAKGTVKFITTSEGLPSNTAYCIEKDATGVLWIGLANGLCRANLQKKSFVLFDRRDGITYDNFMKNGAFRLSGDRLAFTTDHNFMAFRTGSFTSERHEPPVPRFTSIKLSNRPLLVDSVLKLKKLSLGYDNNSIAIEFSGLHFLKQKQLVYYYKMEGLDRRWLAAEENNAAIYNHLPPGSYVFKVESRNQDGVFSPQAALLYIEVASPFWRTWWFYALVTLLLITLLYVFDKERLQRMRALQQVRSQIAGNLHDEINITLNDINLLSEIAKLKADKDIDRSKDYIDQISVKSRGMIEAMDDMLWSIDPVNDSVDKMLLRLKEFTDGFKNTHGTQIELNADKSIRHLNMDMRCRYEFIHFFKEALNYAIQQSACRTLYISLEYLRNKLHLKILAQCQVTEDGDNGALQSRREMEKRADTLNGSLDVMTDKKSISIILQMAVT